MYPLQMQVLPLSIKSDLQSKFVPSQVAYCGQALQASWVFRVPDGQMNVLLLPPRHVAPVGHFVQPVLGLVAVP